MLGARQADPLGAETARGAGIGRGLGVPTKSVSPAEANEYFGGFVGVITQLDNWTSSKKTREILKWKPSHADLLAIRDELPSLTNAHVVLLARPGALRWEDLPTFANVVNGLAGLPQVEQRGATLTRVVKFTNDLRDELTVLL